MYRILQFRNINEKRKSTIVRWGIKLILDLNQFRDSALFFWCNHSATVQLLLDVPDLLDFLFLQKQADYLACNLKQLCFIMIDFYIKNIRLFIRLLICKVLKLRAAENDWSDVFVLVEGYDSLLCSKS